MARPLLLIYFLLALGCADQAGNGRADKSGPADGRPADGRPADKSADALDVYEATFRYRLQKQPGDVKPADVVAYLSVDGKDPAAELLKRLRKDWPKLQPVSAEPKERGLRLHVEGLKWGTQGTAELNAGYWFPTKFAGEGYFADHHLIRDKGRWVVTRVTNETSS
jgi:hypothetical protein